MLTNLKRWNSLSGFNGCSCAVHDARCCGGVSTVLKSMKSVDRLCSDQWRFVFFRLLADIRTFARHLESWVLAATVELPDYLKTGKIQGVLRIYVLYCLLILYSYPFSVTYLFFSN